MKENRGGKREGAGRKAVKHPREPLTLYVSKLIMKQKGGKAALRKELYSYIGQRIDNTDAD